MPRILEWKTWKQYNPHSKTYHWHGYALIDQVYDSDDELEAAVAEVNNLHKIRWAKVMKKLNLDNGYDIPVKIRKQLDDLYAEELREVYGRDRKDARQLNQPKRIDLVRLAENNNILVDGEFWGDKVIKAIEDGTIRV